MKVPQFPSIQTLKSVKSVGVLMMTLLQLPIMVNSSPLIFLFFTVFIKKGDFIILAVYLHRAILCVNFILNHSI